MALQLLAGDWRAIACPRGLVQSLFCQILKTCVFFDLWRSSPRSLAYFTSSFFRTLGQPWRMLVSGWLPKLSEFTPSLWSEPYKRASKPCPKWKNPKSRLFRCQSSWARISTLLRQPHHGRIAGISWSLKRPRLACSPNLKASESPLKAEDPFVRRLTESVTLRCLLSTA